MSLSEVDDMPFQEFSEWRAYFEWDPVGELRADYRAASLMCMIANIHRNPKRRASPFSPHEFVMDFTGEVKKARDEMRRREEAVYLKNFFDRIHAEQERKNG